MNKPKWCGADKRKTGDRLSCYRNMRTDCILCGLYCDPQAKEGEEMKIKPQTIDWGCPKCGKVVPYPKGQPPKGGVGYCSQVGTYVRMIRVRNRKVKGFDIRKAGRKLKCSNCKWYGECRIEGAICGCYSRKEDTK